MVDSTYPLTPPSQPASQDHGPGSAGRADPGAVPVRRAILDLIGGEHWRLVRSLLEVDASEGRISADYAESPLWNVVSATVDTVHQAAVCERSPRDLDLLAFKVLGARCGGAAQDFADAVGVLDACAEAIRTAVLIQAHQLDAVYGERKIDRASASLCRVAEVASRRAQDALLAGHEAALTGVLPLRHVARRNGAAIVVRHPSVTLGSARAAYRDTVASLPEVIAARGQRSTVVTSHAPTGPRTPVPVAA